MLERLFITLTYVRAAYLIVDAANVTLLSCDQDAATIVLYFGVRSLSAIDSPRNASHVTLHRSTREGGFTWYITGSATE